MGTRADFYIGRGEHAEGIGSIAYDGAPMGVAWRELGAKSERVFRDEVEDLIRNCSHGTTPDQGWPWPWDDSRTTDYAYAFDDGTVFMSAYGRRWVPVSPDDLGDDYWKSPKVAIFPRFGGRVRALAEAGTHRSGIMVVG